MVSEGIPKADKLREMKNCNEKLIEYAESGWKGSLTSNFNVQCHDLLTDGYINDYNLFVEKSEE